MLRSNYHYNFLKALYFFRRSQHWNRSQILNYQNKKLQEVIRHAGRNVPYYRELFKEIGLDLQSFRGIEDMHKIPLLDKEQVRKNPELFLADDFKRYGGGFTKTSGSTGTPLRLHIDNISKAYKYAAVLRAYKYSGYKLYSKSLLIQGYSAEYDEPYGYRLGSNSIFFNAIKNSEATFLNFYPLLMKHRPKFIFGYARVAAQMCRYIERNGLEFPKVHAIVNHGEFVPASDIELLKEKLNCRYDEFYSMTENVSMISLDRNDRRIFIDDYFFPEVLDEKEHFESVKYGELIATSFYNYSMPLIRYKTRDLVEIEADGDDKPTIIKAITGRKNDKILLPDGTEILFVEDPLSMGLGRVKAAQYIQEKHGELVVRLIVDEGFDSNTISAMEQKFIERLGNNLKYKFEITDELEKRGDGKVPFIISRLNFNDKPITN